MRRDVEKSYGTDCVASLPNGRKFSRFTTPDDRPLLAIRNPNPHDLPKLVASDGYSNIRFWVHPDGSELHAWSAGDVTHWQIYGSLAKQGWQQGRIRLNTGSLPIVTIQDECVDLVLSSTAIGVMTDGPFKIHTNLRTLDSQCGSAEPGMR